MIDPHVHLRDWDQKAKETVKHGLECAKLAGFDHVFDMPNTSPPITSEKAVIERLKLAQDANVEGIEYSLYVGLTADPKQVKEAVRLYREYFPRVIALKLFAGHSTGNMGICSVEEQRLIFKTLAEEDYRGVVVTHSEKEDLMKSELYINGHFETHSYARPPEAEIASVSDLIGHVKASNFKGQLHIAHISTKGALELVKQAKAEGVNITSGSTPHHSLFCLEDAASHELYLKMNPPLRSKEDRDAIFSGLLDGSIDNAESDHAPHTLTDKENGASGIPGFVGMLLLLDKLREAGASEAHLCELFGNAVLKQFSLPERKIILPLDTKERIKRLRGEYPFDPYVNL